MTHSYSVCTLPAGATLAGEGIRVFNDDQCRLAYSMTYRDRYGAEKTETGLAVPISFTSARVKLTACTLNEPNGWDGM